MAEETPEIVVEGVAGRLHDDAHEHNVGFVALLYAQGSKTPWVKVQMHDCDLGLTQAGEQIQLMRHAADSLLEAAEAMEEGGATMNDDDPPAQPN